MFVQREIVGYKRRINNLLDDEVPPTSNFDAGLIDNFGSAEVQAFGALGKANENIEFSEATGR